MSVRGGGVAGRIDAWRRLLRRGRRDQEPSVRHRRSARGSVALDRHPRCREGPLHRPARGQGRQPGQLETMRQQRGHAVHMAPDAVTRVRARIGTGRRIGGVCVFARNAANHQRVRQGGCASPVALGRQHGHQCAGQQYDRSKPGDTDVAVRARFLGRQGQGLHGNGRRHLAAPGRRAVRHLGSDMGRPRPRRRSGRDRAASVDPAASARRGAHPCVPGRRVGALEEGHQIPGGGARGSESDQGATRSWAWCPATPGRSSVSREVVVTGAAGGIPKVADDGAQ